jgi:hypothetical protein
VNTNDLFGSQHELLMALFGVGATPLIKGTTQGYLEVALPHDGLWIRAATPRNTQVSGVLFTQKLSPANLGNTAATLYINPWAQLPYSGVLRQLPTTTFTADATEHETRAGRSLLDLLQVEPDWPSWPPEPLDEGTPVA